MPNFYEFFAGGGLARIGLGSNWSALFANDFDTKKAEVYRNNFGRREFHFGDVAQIGVKELPGRPDLVWASFPCQDLSLAGNGAGLIGDRSGTFWPFWKLVVALKNQRRAPNVIVLENVCGLITSNGGTDFSQIIRTTIQAGYRVGALVADASLFLPQSRPRLFFVAVKRNLQIPLRLTSDKPNSRWHTAALVETHKLLDEEARRNWIWWNLPTPPTRVMTLSDLIEADPTGVEWHSTTETKRLLSMMTQLNLSKVKQAQRTGGRVVGTLYKRIRDGVQRAEVRFDGIAGCLRTPTGGSSRQTILVVEGKKISSRLLSPREVARLMGIPEDYKLPAKYNDTYHLAGDGLAVPVVRYLAENLIEPILETQEEIRTAA